MIGCWMANLACYCVRAFDAVSLRQSWYFVSMLDNRYINIVLNYAQSEETAVKRAMLISWKILKVYLALLESLHFRVQEGQTTVYKMTVVWVLLKRVFGKFMHNTRPPAEVICHGPQTIRSHFTFPGVIQSQGEFMGNEHLGCQSQRATRVFGLYLRAGNRRYALQSY